MSDETITITVGREKKELRISEIEYLTGSENYSFVHAKGVQRPFIVSRSLKYMEEKLPTFLRIHKRALVNPAHVTGLKLSKSLSYVKFSNDRLFMIARRRAATQDFAQLCKP